MPGADTAEVLKQLGYTDEQIQAMLASGAAIAAKENS
jgi:crotonobetainyl-CoA:carnitine CoA-transferase CaiB-like acyl-CoA transferase